MRPMARVLFALGIVASLLGYIVGARATVPAGAPADHFLAYKTKRPKGAPKLTVVPALRVVDRLEDRRYDVTDAGDLLVPAGVAGGAIADADTHLQAYVIKLSKVCSDTGAPCAGAKACNAGAKCKKPAVAKHLAQTFLDPFGFRVVDLVKAERLLVPSAKSLSTIPPAPNPASHAVDHYTCWKAKLARNASGPPKGTTLTLADQLTPSKRFVVGKLTHVCAPADVNQSGVENETGHLLCYAVKGAKGEPKHAKRTGIGVNDELGPLTRDTTGERAVCVPAAFLPGGTVPTPTTGGSATPVPTPTGSGGLPPDPAAVAPAVAAGVGTTVFDSTAFLYAGPNAIQTGVAPGAIELERAAVIRGRVFAQNATPLAGVTIRILGRPELGQTLTRADGGYDLVVNGGGALVVTFEKSGLLPAQRQVDVPWQDWVTVPDVMLVALDPAVTTIGMDDVEAQVARGSTMTDADGSRQATVMFPPGTGAEIVMPNGSTQAMGSLSVRATEFTVGPDGPMKMPAELPPTSGYTYAVELSADEAIAAGATEVRFDQPLALYVENFIGFPTGTWVPTGYYDRTAGRWVASDSGRVIAIVATNGGVADVDIDGDGNAEDAAGLTAAGITDAERTRLAALYTVGQTLSRIPITHFTPFDCNYPYGPPPDSDPPCPTCRPLPPADKPPDDPCQRKGSIVECQSQTLGETIDVTGVPFGLHYRSNRTPARGKANVIDIRLTDATVPPPLQSVRVEIAIAGRVFKETFPPTPNQTYQFVWDGKDAYGRKMNGRQPAKVRVGYQYVAQYYATASEFAESYARFGSLPITRAVSGGGGGGGGGGVVFDIFRRESRVTAPPITLFQEFETSVGGPLDARAQALGGWTLGVHHVYDPIGRELLLGNGGRRDASDAAQKIDTIGGLGSGFVPVEGIPAKQALFDRVDDMEVGPDGSLYVVENAAQRVRRIGPDGIVTLVAGNGNPCGAPTLPCGDGGQATQAQLREPQGIAVAPDGTVYIADTNNARIRRVGTDGIITTVAGNGSFFFEGDGVPATETGIRPADVAIGPDGSLYWSEVAVDRVRRVGPDGIVATIAGPNAPFADCMTPMDPCGDGGPATEATLGGPRGIAVAPDGSVYVTTQANKVRRIGPDGVITTVAGTGKECFNTGTPCGDGGLAINADLKLPFRVAVTSDGRLLIADGTMNRLRVVAPSGIITSIAGTGTSGASAGDGGFATQAVTPFITAVAVAPNATVYLSNAKSGGGMFLRRLGPVLPGLRAGDAVIPDEEARELYVFDASGRHERTLDALTGAALLTFGYDAGNRLVTITDADGNATTVERGGDGQPTAIVAPGGQRTTLAVNADGYLVSVANPAGQTTALAYATGTATGLLTSYTNARGQASQFTYDADGRLVRDQGPDGTDTTLARTELGDGSYKVAVTTAEGVTTTYQDELLESGDRRRARTDPGGGQTVALIHPDGRRELAYPDGTTATIVSGPDPRFGVQAPILASLVVATPGGLTGTRTATRAVVLTNPDDPLSLVSMTDTVTRNGKTETQVYDAATRTFTTTTAGGRSIVTTLDAVGRRVLRHVDPGLGGEPILWSYDAQGRLDELSHGAQSWTWTYDAKNRPTARVDALGGSLGATFDLADRRTAVSLPSGKSYGLQRDPNGNPTVLAMPSTATHALAYDQADLLTSYTPPSSSPYAFTRDDDRRVMQVALPSGRTKTHAFDAADRLVAITTAEAISSLTYAAGRRLTQLTRTPTTGTPQTIAFTYDADVPIGATWTGAATADYDYDWSDDFLLASLAVTSGTDTVTTNYVRDDDGFVTGLGPFTLTRSGPGGAATAITDGTATTTLTYDALGRVASRALTVGGVGKYSAVYTFDAVGRVTRKVETVAGVPATFDYTYDADGQLLQVKRDDDVVETYAYDANQNRLSRKLGGGAVENATYDTQDRLTQQGAVAYTSDADGFVVQRGADTFQWAATGELLQATVGGQTVTYGYDGLRRRVSRTLGGVTTQYLYGDPGEALRVTHTRDAGGTFTTYYYDDGGRLFALERSGTRYYVAADQLGSPIAVVDATGTLVKTREYDAFGRVVSDGAPSFELALGFAGGIADPTTGFVRFGARDYDPAAGRWTGRDPALYEGRQANLYAYVHNSPVNLVDPSGLASLEASAYEGLGAGFKFAIDGDGLSLCGEAGVGAGSSIGLDLFEGADDTSLGLVAEAEAKAGALRGKAKGELLVNFGPGRVGDCPPEGEAKGELKFCGGPACVGVEGGTKEGADPRGGADVGFDKLSDLSRNNLKNLLKGGVGEGLEAKLAVKGCQHFSF